VVGEEEKNGGLWCSPIANTSSPTSSVFWAIWVIASIRSASLGVSPDTGSRVMSLTEKIPNCMSCLRYMRLHVPEPSAAAGYSGERDSQSHKAFPRRRHSMAAADRR